jgi:hypothetical protein
MFKRILVLVTGAFAVSTSTVTKTMTVCSSPTPLTMNKVNGTIECMRYINEYRKKNNIPILKSFPSKNQCTNKQGYLDYIANEFHNNFGMCKENAQCECKGFKNVKQCIDAYMSEGKGGGHYDILLSKEYTHVSCGQYKIAKNKYFHIQNFYTLKQPQRPQWPQEPQEPQRPQWPQEPQEPQRPQWPQEPQTGTTDCVNLINQFRQSLGLTALRPATSEQNQCANNAALNDKVRGFHNSFGQCRERAQCECNGQMNVKQCIDAYISEGPGGGHYEILKGPYTSVACGTDGGRFYTHNFY